MMFSDLENVIVDLNAYDYWEEIQGIHSEIEDLKNSYKNGEISKKIYEQELKKLNAKDADMRYQWKNTKQVISSLQNEFTKLNVLRKRYIVSEQIRYLIFLYDSVVGKKTNKTLLLFNLSMNKPKSRKISKKIYTLIKKNKKSLVQSRYSSDYKTLEDTINLELNSEGYPQDYFKNFRYIKNLILDSKSSERREFNSIEDMAFNFPLKNNNNNYYYNSLDFLESNYDKFLQIPSYVGKMTKAKNMFNKLINISSQTIYYDEILNVVSTQFSDCTDLAIYKWLKEYNNELKSEIIRLDSIATSICSELENKLNIILKLDEEYEVINNLIYKLEVEKDILKYNNLLAEYNTSMNNIMQILKDNPELNNKFYREFIKHNFNKFKTKKTKDNDENKSRTIVEKILSNKVIVNEKQDEVKEKDSSVQRNSNIDKLNNGKNEEFELEKKRKKYYQKYMEAKRDNLNIGKYSFSEYLKIIASNEEELILQEQKRESLAKTIFKDYLRYYASIADKTTALSFKKYGKTMFHQDMNLIEVPIEFEEQYRKMLHL